MTAPTGASLVRRAGAWAFALLLYGGFAAWLFAHPAAIPSDDALYFSRGLVRFSVLDFSPQFPGYPGFIALGRAVRLWRPDPASALFVLTVCVALALPPVAAWIGWRARGSAAAALCAFGAALSQPLLPDLGLNMTSDGAGVLFLLLFFALAPQERAQPSASPEQSQGAMRDPRLWLAGFALGWAACCRPSDAALLAGALLGLAFASLRAAAPVAIGAALVGAPALLVLYALTGSLYWSEGWRFATGHAELWGNTAFSQQSGDGGWIGALARIPYALPAFALALAGAGAAAARWREASPVLLAMLGAFGADLLWEALLQNPDHLRHLAPLALVGGLLLVLAPGSARGRAAATALLVLANGVALARSLDPAPHAPPPLRRAIERLAQAPQGGAVAANEGVETLRAALPRLRVYDMFYRDDSLFGLAQAAGDAFRLTASPLPGAAPIAAFPGRALGEESFYLYRFPVCAAARDATLCRRRMRN